MNPYRYNVDSIWTQHNKSASLSCRSGFSFFTMMSIRNQSCCAGNDGSVTQLQLTHINRQCCGSASVSGLDQDSMGVPGSRNAIWPTKIEKNVNKFHFLKCFLRAEGFSCSLDGKVNCNFWSKKEREKNFQLYFSPYQPWIEIGSGSRFTFLLTILSGNVKQRTG